MKQPGQGHNRQTARHRSRAGPGYPTRAVAGPSNFGSSNAWHEPSSHTHPGPCHATEQTSAAPLQHYQAPPCALESCRFGVARPGNLGVGVNIHDLDEASDGDVFVAGDPVGVDPGEQRLELLVLADC